MLRALSMCVADRSEAQGVTRISTVGVSLLDVCVRPCLVCEGLGAMTSSSVRIRHLAVRIPTLSFLN